MTKSKKLLLIVGLSYAVAIAGLATTNLLHNFFGINGIAEQRVNDDPFANFEESTPASSAKTSTPSSSGSAVASQSESEPVASSSETTVTVSPYTETTTTFTRYRPGEYDPNNECYDSRGNEIIFYTLEIKIKKITDLRTNQVTDSNGYPGDNCLSTVYNQIKDVEKKYNVTVLGAISGDSSYNNLDHRLGYVLRNGQVLRTQTRTGNDAVFEDLVLWNDGTMSLYIEPGFTGTRRTPSLPTYTTADLTSRKAWQVWTFGPTLVYNNVISVGEDDDVASPHQAGNQRTAIGYLGPFHYMFLVSQGRNKGQTDGFSLHDLAQRLYDRGCSIAYNLDGGDSSTFYCLDETGTAKRYPTQKNPRALGDMIYVVDA